VREASEIFRDHLRGCVREMICEVMASEVDQLCGAKHQPNGGELFRAGSSSGRVLVDGQREEGGSPPNSPAAGGRYDLRGNAGEL